MFKKNSIKSYVHQVSISYISLMLCVTLWMSLNSQNGCGLSEDFQKKCQLEIYTKVKELPRYLDRNASIFKYWNQV